MEAVLREIRQLAASINESVRNAKKTIVILSDISNAINSINKRLDKIEEKIIKLEKK